MGLFNINSDEFTQDNLGGGKRLLFVPVADVESISPIWRNSIESSIVLKPGKQFYELIFILDTLRFKENRKVSSGATTYTVTITGILPKSRVELYAMLQNFDSKRFILVYVDKNGTQRLVGSIRNPAIFNDSDANDGGRTEIRNELVVEFNWLNDKPALYYGKMLDVFQPSDFKVYAAEYKIKNLSLGETVFEMPEEIFFKPMLLNSISNASSGVVSHEYNIDNNGFVPAVFPINVNVGTGFILRTTCLPNTSDASYRLNGQYL